MDGADRKKKKDTKKQKKKTLHFKFRKRRLWLLLIWTDSSFSYYSASASSIFSHSETDIYLFPAFACSLTAAQQVQQVRPQREHNRQGLKFQLRIVLLTHFLFCSCLIVTV